MTKNKPSLVFWSGVIGNALDHYDVALYGLLTPFIAPIFFPSEDYIVQLILGYGLMSTGIITRPIGAFFFGRMATKYGPKTSLVITLSGVSISTLCIGLIPGYDAIGIYAPILLVIVRMAQGLFASGEHSVSMLFIMEHVKNGNHAKASSYYLISTMGGMLVASGVATWVSASSDPSYYWRFPFFASILTGAVGLFLRFLLKDVQNLPKGQETKGLEIIKINKSKLIRIIIVSSFSHMTYVIPFVFFNTFIPILHPNITNTTTLFQNTLLLVLDVTLLLICGRITDKMSYSKWMASMSFVLFLTIIPAFYLLSSSSMNVIIAVRLWIIIIGVGFVTPLKAWFFKILSGQEKYLVLGVGYAIGAEFLGRSTTAICLFLWYEFGLIGPAIYIALLSLAATIALTFKAEKI